jgi:hypothetical protein
MYINIISLERFNERLGNAVRLRRPHRREAGNEADRLSEGDGIVSAVTATVIREPFDGIRGLLTVKTPLDALKHQVSDHFAGDAAGGGKAGHHLAITGVKCEGNTNALTVPAGDLEAVRRPGQVRADGDDLTVVRSFRRLASVALQQEAVLRHQAVSAFVVEPG